MIDANTLLQIGEAGLAVIGFASVALHIVAPLTKNTFDNKLVEFLDKFLKVVSLHKTNDSVKISIKTK